jgi:hypothetical protein
LRSHRGNSSSSKEPEERGKKKKKKKKGKEKNRNKHATEGYHPQNPKLNGRLKKERNLRKPQSGPRREGLRRLPWQDTLC